MNRTHTNRGERTNDCGFTLIEVLVIVFVITVLVALSVPMLLRARMAANESSAIASLRAINSAQTGYSSSAAQGNYATDLTVLSQACPGGSVGFIAPDLSQDPSIKAGYVITLDPGSATPGADDCNGDPTWQGYYLKGEPISIGRTGHRAFATTNRAAIFVDPTGTAPTEAVVLAATGTPLQ